MKRQPLMVLILCAIVSLSSCFICGCAPTLAWYVEAHRPLPTVSRCPEPLMPMTLAVVDFRDYRPGNEKVNIGNAIIEVIAHTITLGITAVDLAYNEGHRIQPFTHVDKDVPDYIAITLRNANLFSSVTRVQGGAELFDNLEQMEKWRKTHNEDLVLVGNIRHIWGKWHTGTYLSTTTSVSYPFKYTTNKYELLGAGGYVSLSLKLIRTSNSEVYWERDLDVYEPHIGDLHIGEEQFTQNNLAAAAFYKSLGVVAEEIRLYLETHPRNIETTSK